MVAHFFAEIDCCISLRLCACLIHHLPIGIKWCFHINHDLYTVREGHDKIRFLCIAVRLHCLLRGIVNPFDKPHQFKRPLQLHFPPTPTRCRVAEDLDKVLCLVAEERSEEHTSELQSQSNLICRLP